MAVKSIAHRDLRGRHVGVDLDLGLARDRLRALGVELVLGFHQRAHPAHAGAVDHAGA